MKTMTLLTALMVSAPFTTRQARTEGTPTTIPAPASNGSSDSFARVDHTHPLMSCANGMILKSNGTGWGCAADLGATYTAGNNLVLSGTEFALDSDPVVVSLDITGRSGLMCSYAGPFTLTSSAPATAAIDVAHVVDTVTPYASFGSTDKIMSWRMGGQEVAYLNKFDFGFPTGHGYFASLMVGSWRVASPRSNAGSQNLAVYSAANAAGEFGVVAGTSESSTGQTSFAVCNDCDGAAPAYLFKVEGSGNASLTGTMTAAAFAGNASTATALAADPADCSGNQWARGISANGTAACAQPAFSNLSGRVARSQLPDFDSVAGLPLLSGGPVDDPGWSTLPPASISNTTAGRVIKSGGASPPSWGLLDFGELTGQVEPPQIQDGPEGFVLTGSGGKTWHAEWKPSQYQGSFYAYYTHVDVFSGWPFHQNSPEDPWSGAFRPEKDGAFGAITCTGDGYYVNGPDSGNLDVGVWDYTDQRTVCSCVLDGPVGSCGLDSINPVTCDCLNDGQRVLMEAGHVYGLILPMNAFGCVDFPRRMDCNVTYFRG